MKNTNHKTASHINRLSKSYLFKTAEFLLKEENRQLIDTNNFEELYENACKEGIYSYISEIVRKCGIDVFPYVEKVRSGMIDSLTEELVIPDNVIEIERESLGRLQNLSEVIIGRGVKKMGNHIFAGDDKLVEVIYKGTQDEWRKIDKSPCWATGSYVKKVNCGDGAVIDVDEEHKEIMYKQALEYIKNTDPERFDSKDELNDLIKGFSGDQNILKQVLENWGISRTNID